MSACRYRCALHCVERWLQQKGRARNDSCRSVGVLLSGCGGIENTGPKGGSASRACVIGDIFDSYVG